MFSAYLVISRYKISEGKHSEIVANTAKRDELCRSQMETTPGVEVVPSASAGGEKEVGSDAGVGILGEIVADFRNSQLFQDDTEQDSLELYAGKSRSGQVDGSTRAFEQGSAVELGAVDDPLTGVPVVPPPFALAIQTIDRELVQTASRFPRSEDHLEVRLLALYFPQLLHVVSSREGRSMVLSMYGFEIVTGVVFLGLGMWQVSGVE